MKDEEAKRPPVSKMMWALMFAIGLSLAAFFGVTEYSRYSMKAMNCEKLSPEEFDRSLAEASLHPVYTANKSEPSVTINFIFNLLPSVLSDAVFVIESAKVRAPIFAGPYKDRITIEAGPRLFDDRGVDSFKFYLFRKNSKEVCVFEHGATSFWQAGKTVYIDFLPYRELDADTGEPVAFKVRFE